VFYIRAQEKTPHTRGHAASSSVIAHLVRRG
jgi:mevalonate pyrophosphate decarboxylase